MKDREKKTGKGPRDPEEEEKARKAEKELCLTCEDEDEVTMRFFSKRLKDSCSD